MEGIAFVPIHDPSQTAEARRVALRMADALQCADPARGNLAIVVTEAATNLLKHGGGGLIVLRYTADGSLEVLALDHGPGMYSLADCLRDGYSTAGSAGTGLGAIDRLSERLEIHTVPGAGTVLAATCSLRPRGAAAPSPASPWDWAALVAPVGAEPRSGDTAAIRPTGPDSVQVLVADGLGHGTLAAEASDAARAIFTTHAGSPRQLIELMHPALRPTRGAAVAITEIDRAAGTVRFCGIGNIGASIFAGEPQHLISMNGIVGHQSIRPREFEYRWSPGALIALYSDGISSRWQWSAYTALTNRPASLVAATLFRDHRKLNDDATVVVLRERLPS